MVRALDPDCPMIFRGSFPSRALLVAGLVLAPALLCLRYGHRWLHREPETSASPGRSAGLPWTAQTVAGLTLEASFPFTPAADPLGTLPEAVREMIAGTEVFEGKDGRLDLKVTILRVEYRPGVPLSLEGAALEAVNNAAAGAGDLHPSYNITPTQISGCDARRTEYHRRIGGQEVYLTGIIVLRDRELWEVQVFSTSDDAQRSVDRLLASLTLAPSALRSHDAGR